MSRRSSRLRSVGYYNSEDESDSSTTTNISYRENPVKVFKKKSGRKSASRTTSNASSASTDSLVAAAVTPPSLDGTESRVGAGRYFPSMAPTPRPPISPVQTPTRCPSAPPPYSGLSSSMAIRPALQRLSDLVKPTHSGFDSSGYSSSDAAPIRPASAAAAASTSTSTSRPGSRPGSRPVSGLRSRVGSDFLRLKDSVSGTAAAAHSKIVHVTSLVGSPSFSSHMKKVVGLALLLIVLILCVWFLLPWLAPLVSRLSVTKTSLPARPVGWHAPPAYPILPLPSPPPSPHPATPPAPVLAEAAVLAAVKAKMQPLLEEMQLKQEHLVSQMQHVQADVQAVRMELHALDAGGRQHLEEELASLGRKMAGNHAESTAANAKLRVRVAAVEAQNTQLAQELMSAQQVAPPAPQPEPEPEPPAQQEPLSPELLEALEKWLSQRFQEQEELRLDQTESCSDCKLPIARRMADFALESQGASVISTRCSETYRTRSACVTLFGFPLWYPSESPRIVIQGYPALLPGKCWAFHGVQGTLVIALSHPITITHVTLDHLPRYHSPTGRIDSAPKDFAVYGMINETDEGTLLGAFTYDEDGESMQTFELPEPSEVVYRVVELRVLTNWGHVEYTCLYRFRVHGQIAAAS